MDDSELKCEREEADEILRQLNDIEPGVIIFTMEKDENDTLPVVDLKQTIDRKTKKIRFTVHYKATHTNINVSNRSNHPDSTKKGVIRGFAERARALCDSDQIEEELKNIEDICFCE